MFDFTGCYLLGPFWRIAILVFTLFASGWVVHSVLDRLFFGYSLSVFFCFYFVVCILMFPVLIHFVSRLTESPSDKIACAEIRLKELEESSRSRQSLAELQANPSPQAKLDDQDPVEDRSSFSFSDLWLGARFFLQNVFDDLVQSLDDKEPVEDRSRFILSALWLGASFFLERIFEKLFHDKGYALLAVCAVGFLLAFFSANYFLFGGSVTGGLMGSLGRNNA